MIPTSLDKFPGWLDKFLHVSQNLYIGLLVVHLHGLEAVPLLPQQQHDWQAGRRLTVATAYSLYFWYRTMLRAWSTFIKNSSKGRPQKKYSEMIMLIPLWEVCWKWGMKRGVTWRMLWVPDLRHGGQGHLWHHGWPWKIPRKIPWKFCVDIFIGSVPGMECQKGGNWRTLSFPGWSHGGQDYPWHNGLPYFTPS